MVSACEEIIFTFYFSVLSRDVVALLPVKLDVFTGFCICLAFLMLLLNLGFELLGYVLKMLVDECI